MAAQTRIGFSGAAKGDAGESRCGAVGKFAPLRRGATTFTSVCNWITGGECGEFADFARLTRIPAEDEALREPVRDFLRDALALLRQRLALDRGSASMRHSAAVLGVHGWIGLTFPTAYGGQGRGAFARFVVVEELLDAGAPVAAHWFADRQSGPLILRYGTEAQRQQYLPGICRGNLFFCIGMSEPNTGST